MSKNLISVGSHGNNMALYKEFVDNHWLYAKVSCDLKSNILIEREYSGYAWYFKNILMKENLIRIDKGPFFELTVPEFQGEKCRLEGGFHLEQDKMLRIVQFYKEKWPTNENFSIHGDMSLSNFIFNKSGIFLIDWEHFHKSDLSYYGFDIINMLFISFCRGGHVAFSDKSFIKKCYRVLFDDLAFNSKIVDRPFYKSKKYLQKLYNGNENNLNKFVLAFFPDNKLNHLDKYITG